MSTQSDESGLRALGVSFAYDTEPVVRDVTLSIWPGDSVALCGPNGSGKSTLVKLLSGELLPQSGSVLLDGHSLRLVRPTMRARQIAVVPQRIDPQLAFPVRVLVGMGRAPYSGLFGTLSDQDEAAIRAAMDVTDTARFSTRRFSDLSGGEQQRVALAMALAQDTDFLLLDEPTVHLDLRHQFEMLELLRGLQRTRTLGLLAVLHDLNLAALYFDRLLVLQAGAVVAEGPCPEILRSQHALAVFEAPLSVVDHPDAGVPQVLLRPTQ